jgi:uncharacterized protein (TIGR02996 family)
MAGAAGKAAQISYGCYASAVGTAELVAHLRSLPDDWPTWLVYADALSERGDVRGQLLVLAHHDATARELEDLEDEWMITWGDRLPYGDRAAYDWHRQLAPLGRRAPSDLRPIFSRPISQLLALLELDERVDLSPPFELHQQHVIEATLAWIDRAFDGVPAPDRDHRTLYQAEAADNYEGCDRSRDFLGRWQELPDEQLLANQWALAHLDEQGIRYYAPAVMTFALRHPHHDDDRWLTESFEYTLQRSSRELRDYQRERFSLFDREQRAAIYAFAVVRRHTAAAKAWSRVFEAERDEARSDWFEIFSP